MWEEGHQANESKVSTPENTKECNLKHGATFVILQAGSSKKERLWMEQQRLKLSLVDGPNGDYWKGGSNWATNLWICIAFGSAAILFQ